MSMGNNKVEKKTNVHLSCRPNFSKDGNTIRNLKGAMYKLSMQSISGRVTGMAVIPDKQHVIVSVYGQGAIVYK